MPQLSALRDAMRLCRQASPQIRCSQVDFLLSVALTPGRTQTELATECDLTLAAVSRAVDVMGESGRRDGLSGRLGFVETRRTKADDRILQVFLTPSGEQFVSLLETLTYGGSLSR
jgi:DNA-binding MarR family transcriptional regulator